MPRTPDAALRRLRLPFRWRNIFAVSLEVAITLAPYDVTWPMQFMAEAKALQEALAPWLAGPVEHIGSTSVPGLEAKPILDMIAPVQDFETAGNAAGALRGLGYASGVHRPHEAHYFYKPDVEHWWQRTHQLHLTEPTSELWRGRIAFRNALRARPDFRSRYVQLKRSLAASLGDDIDAYAGAKRDFVAEVLASPEAQLDAM